MNIRRLVANFQSDYPNETRDFYEGVLGLAMVMDLDWIKTFASSTDPTAQVTIIRQDPSGIHPNLTAEVDDVDVVHASALEHGLNIVYPLTDEPWGVRRFFVRDPNGQVVNVMRHPR